MKTFLDCTLPYLCEVIFIFAKSPIIHKNQCMGFLSVVLDKDLLPSLQKLVSRKLATGIRLWNVFHNKQAGVGVARFYQISVLLDGGLPCLGSWVTILGKLGNNIWECDSG